jgi:hypothetical protein
MAWMRELVRPCQRCPRLGTHEVFNRQNSSHGVFCKTCAVKEVKWLNQEEDNAASKLQQAGTAVL